MCAKNWTVIMSGEKNGFFGPLSIGAASAILDICFEQTKSTMTQISLKTRLIPFRLFSASNEILHLFFFSTIQSVLLFGLPVWLYGLIVRLTAKILRLETGYYSGRCLKVPNSRRNKQKHYSSHALDIA